MWALWVMLTIGMPRQCISIWPTELECWAAGRNWLDQAAAWRRRSNLERDPLMYQCRLYPFERVQAQ